MRTLDRYVLRELLVPFVLGIAVFTSILLIARILKLVEMVVNRGVPLLDVLRLFSYILPAFLELTLPMALLLAVLVAFGRFSADSELTACYASGVSLGRLMRPVALFALLVTALTLALSLHVRPWGNRLLRTGIYEIVKARASAGIRPKVFNDEFKDLVLYVERVEPPGTALHGILISDTRGAEHHTVYARFGTVVTNEARHSLILRLVDGGIYSGGDGDGYQQTRFSTYDVQLDLGVTLARLDARRLEPQEMALPVLREHIAERRAADQPTFEAEAELQRRFAIPFACLVFAALGVPLGVQPSRSVRSRGFSTSLVFIFAYYLLLTLGQNLAERGAAPAVVALWLPNVALAAVAAGLVAGAMRGPDTSRVALFDRIADSVRRRLAPAVP